MQHIDLIKDLSSAPGVSGFEDAVLETARNHISDSMDIAEDRLRNLYLHHSDSPSDRPRVMLDAHSDEVGFMIQSINANGTLKFLPLGGWNPQIIGAHAIVL